MKTLVKMRVLVVLLLALVRSTLQDTCDPAKCVLPDCRCFGQDIPGGLAVRDSSHHIGRNPNCARVEELGSKALSNHGSLQISGQALIRVRRCSQQFPVVAYPSCSQHLNMSHDMRFPTMLYVRPAKAQTSLRIRAV